MASMEINQLNILPFSPDRDIPRLLEMYKTVESVDQAGIEIDEQLLRTQLSLPGHDPLRDRWVVESPSVRSNLVAAAQVKLASDPKVAEANIIVHPLWRRHGIGSALLSRLETRIQELNATSIQIYANTTNLAAITFLHKYGFSPLGAYTELRLKEGVRLPPVIWPFGYELHPWAAVQDISILTQAMNLSYIPLWGHREVTDAEMASWLAGTDPTGLFLVFSEKGRVIGISRAEPSLERTLKNGKPTGVIDAPGVVPQHRRLDLYRALVLTGIQWLNAHDYSLVEMESWGDKLEVMKMYHELGFEMIHQWICFQRIVSRPENQTP